MSTRQQSCVHDIGPAFRPEAETRFSARLLPVLVLLGTFTASSVAFAQALPAAEASPISTGFSLPTRSGDLTYGVSASESLTWGYYSSQGAASYSNISGDLGYISGSTRDPFSAVVTGGRSWSSSG